LTFFTRVAVVVQLKHLGGKSNNIVSFSAAGSTLRWSQADANTFYAGLVNMYVCMYVDLYRATLTA